LVTILWTPESDLVEIERSIYFSDSGWISSMAISPDGSLLAASDGNQNLWLWGIDDLSTPLKHIIHPYPADWDSAGFNALAFSPDGRALAAGSRGAIYIIDLADLEAAPLVLELPPGATDGDLEITTVGFSPDGNVLAAGGSTGALYFWGIGNLEAAPRIIAAHEGAVMDMLYAPGGKWLISAGADGKVLAWDTEQLTAPVKELAVLATPATALAASPDGKQLLAGFADSTVLSWLLTDLDAGAVDLLPEYTREAKERRERQLKFGGGGPTNTVVHSIALSPDGKYLAIGRDSGEVPIWKMGEYQRPYTILYGSFGADSAELIFSPNRNVLVGGFSAIGNAELYQWKFLGSRH
jgi:WD40 repeat protein